MSKHKFAGASVPVILAEMEWSNCRASGALLASARFINEESPELSPFYFFVGVTDYGDHIYEHDPRGSGRPQFKTIARETWEVYL